VLRFGQCEVLHRRRLPTLELQLTAEEATPILLKNKEYIRMKQEAASSWQRKPSQEEEKPSKTP